VDDRFNAVSRDRIKTVDVPEVACLHGNTISNRSCFPVYRKDGAPKRYELFDQRASYEPGRPGD
jgi:hypothetical protein